MGCINVNLKILKNLSKYIVENKEGFLINNHNKINITTKTDTIININNLTTKRLSVNCSMICSLHKEGDYETFVVSEGVFLLYDGKTFKVLKDELL